MARFLSSCRRSIDERVPQTRCLRGTLEKADFKPGQARRTFRVAMTDMGERYFLPRLSRRLGSEAPRVTLESLSPGLAELTAGLASGDIDLAVGFIPGMGKPIRAQKLFNEEYIYLMRNGHPAAQDMLTAARIRTLRHIVASAPGTQHLRAVEKVLTSPEVRAEIALRVRSFLCVGPIVEETDLVAPVPSNLAALVASNLDLCASKPRVRFPVFEISMYWHRRFHQDPASVWLRGIMLELFARTAAN